DPFIDPNDPEAVEREQRRREREAKRAGKAAKRRQKEAPPPPPPPAEAAPPTRPRTPEQEFWDEPAEPVTPPPLPAPEPGGERAERGRRRLLGRRQAKGTAAAAGGAAAAKAADVAAAPASAGGPAAPPTGEQRVAGGPPTGEGPRPGPIPPQTEAPHALAAEAPQADPGPGTAETPRPDPNQPRREQAPPPRPLEETGAGDWEPPPPRDDWGFADDDLHDEGDPNMAGAARSGRRHGDHGNRRGGFLGAMLRHPFRILGVIVLILVLLFLNALFQPFHGSGGGKVVVDIPKGSSVGEVGDLLEKEGVISGGFIASGSTLFQIRVTLDGKRSGLFAGRFAMKEGMSYGDAIDQLSKEPKVAEGTRPGIVTVTIPEGQSRPITAKLLKEDGIKGNYLKATKKSKLLDPERYGGKKVKSLEGFLFPDTWEFRTNKPVKDLVALQLQDFKKKIKKVNMKYAKSKNLTIFDVVTIASMIEREAGVPKQRKLVASVIYNRLHEGMALGIDSTIRFATGNYEKPLTESELESNSPYNTRTHTGLPPGPINSPGLAALNAAAHPAKTDFLFYVNNPNSCDELTFAKTEEEFLADAAKYEKAREANGGRQPSTCR
ncbi:MAG TPA: endolytic transglycosylase MltG, partial [Solirubrobacterales bacterium]|nr:endolytic transglycosylase MltG [Solirubrobacterales bacterium]